MLRSTVVAMLISGCSVVSLPHPAPPVQARANEGPPLPLAVAGHAGGLVQGKAVVAGGSSWSENRTIKRWHRDCYVFRDSAWSVGPSLPQPLSETAYASGPAGLYVAGGTDGTRSSNLVFYLDSTSVDASWKMLASLPEPIEAASGVIVNDTFYVFGGFSGSAASNRLWALDLRTPGVNWRSLAPLPASGRGYAALTTVGSDLYLFGGFTAPPYEQNVTIFADAYCYDTVSNRWRRLEGLNLPGYALTATTVDAGKIMLTGRVPDVGNVSDEIWLVDLRDNSARSIGHLITPACCMPAIPVSPRQWWLPGGEPDTQRSRTARTSIVTLEGLRTDE